jgi:hypothetical protein
MKMVLNLIFAFRSEWELICSNKRLYSREAFDHHAWCSGTRHHEQSKKAPRLRNLLHNPKQVAATQVIVLEAQLQLLNEISPAQQSPILRVITIARTASVSDTIRSLLIWSPISFTRACTITCDRSLMVATLIILAIPMPNVVSCPITQDQNHYCANILSIDCFHRLKDGKDSQWMKMNHLHHHLSPRRCFILTKRTL